MTITTLIKVTSVGVCHTDLHGMEGHIAFPIPAVFGHEVSGVIEEINCSVEGSRGKYSRGHSKTTLTNFPPILTTYLPLVDIFTK